MIAEAVATQPEVKINLGDIFDGIERQYGALTPDNLLQEASREEHPLHERFEWDDAAAAQTHRLNQARALLRLPRSTVIVNGCRIVSPTYVHDPSLSGNRQGYIPVSRIKSESDMASDAMSAEIDRAAGALRRAHGIAVALGDNDTADTLDAALHSIGRG